MKELHLRESVARKRDREALVVQSNMYNKFGPKSKQFKEAQELRYKTSEEKIEAINAVIREERKRVY